jgi:peptide/nickel transport system substrate-binding protein
MRFIPDEITLVTALRSGTIDLWANIPAAKIDEVRAIPSATVLHQPGFYYSHIDFNTTHPALSERVVRQALRLATDRLAIRNKISHGIGVVQESVITPVSPLSTQIALEPFDPAEANKLLDGAGWVRGSDGVRSKRGVRLRLIWAALTGAPDNDRFIELVRSMWAKVGVELEVRRYAPALFFGPYADGGTLYAGKFDVVSFSWGFTPDGDLSTTNACGQIPPAGQNVTRLCDPAMEPLFLQEKAAYDETARKAVLAATMRRIVTDVPYFTLRIAEDIYAFNKDLSGWKPNAVTPFDDMMNADL